MVKEDTSKSAVDKMNGTPELCPSVKGVIHPSRVKTLVLMSQYALNSKLVIPVKISVDLMHI